MGLYLILSEGRKDEFLSKYKEKFTPEDIKKYFYYLEIFRPTKNF